MMLRLSEANPSLGGYDDDFVSEVEDELQCVICRLPYHNNVFGRTKLTLA